jgi:hypothetical protein
MVGAACCVGMALLTACTRQAVPGAETPSPMSEARDVTVEIDNENFSDVTIYWIRNQDTSNPGRVGYVTGFSKKTFTFRWSSGELEFRIDFLAGGSVFTQALAVDPGDSLNLVVTPDLHRRAVVRSR